MPRTKLARPLVSIASLVFAASVLVGACTRRTTSSATCRIGESCFQCPSGDAAAQCLAKLDGIAAGCKPAARERCN